jgi:hypothetical protein
MAFDDTCPAIGEIPEARSAVPARRSQRLAIGRKRQRGNRAFMTLEHTRRRLPFPTPERDAAILAGAGEPAIRQGDERIYRAFVETQHLPCRAARKIPADDGGIETRGCRTIACEQNGAHWPAMPAQIRCQRTRGEQETSGNPGGTADKIHAASRLQRAYRTIWRIGAPRKALL